MQNNENNNEFSIDIEENKFLKNELDTYISSTHGNGKQRSIIDLSFRILDSIKFVYSYNYLMFMQMGVFLILVGSVQLVLKVYALQ